VFNPVALVAALFDPALTEQKTPQNPGLKNLRLSENNTTIDTCAVGNKFG